MIFMNDRTYGPTHLTLDECRESHRPTIVQSLAAHIVELKAEHDKLKKQLEGTASAAPTPTLAAQAPGGQQ